MTVNGTRPTGADVRAAFAALPDFEEVPVADPVAESERAVLGAVIQSSEAAGAAAAIITPAHFATPAHQLIFEAVMRLADAGDPVEPATVLAELARAGTLAKVGAQDMGTGGVYLHNLMQRAGDIGYHARVIRDDWVRREVRLAVAQCWQIANTPGFDLDEHLDQIRVRIEAATAYTTATALRPNSETVYEVLGTLEDDVEPGLSTGYPDLDDFISLRPGELTVIGARPGQGKSLIALCIADHVGTRLGVPVLFSSLEMTEQELTQRRIAAAAKVPLQHIVRHQVTDAEWEQIRRVQEQLTATSLYVDDTTSVSPAYIRGQLRTMARTGRQAGLLVIDYLGFMGAPKAESRQQAVAELARQAKNIARDFSIPVILLAQLNRGSEHRAEKRPQLSDLRESGEIEQSADNVILLHREDAYEPESARAGEIDVIISKHRQGQQVTVTLCFQGQYGRIVSLGREWSPSSVIGA